MPLCSNLQVVQLHSHLYCFYLFSIYLFIHSLPFLITIEIIILGEYKKKYMFLNVFFYPGLWFLEKKLTGEHCIQNPDTKHGIPCWHFTSFLKFCLVICLLRWFKFYVNCHFMINIIIYFYCIDIILNFWKPAFGSYPPL